jgi:Spherulation-specific family 4
MPRRSAIWLSTILLLTAGGVASPLDDPPAARRRQKAQEFHLRAQERTGVLVPLYVYPADLHKNPAYNRLADIKRRFETVPFWVIVNPNSGPGEKVDANYTEAIDRLEGAGCVTLGYVTTSYGKKPQAQARKEVDRWLALYPRIHGIFFDEMVYEDNEASVKYQASLSQYAHEAGCWPTVANPGVETPGHYFAADAADVIVVHDGPDWPKEERLKADFFGGNAAYPPFTRAVLIHSQAKLDRTALGMARKYARWIYSTDGPYRPNDPKAANPWDRVSAHLEELCELLQRP